VPRVRFLNQIDWSDWSDAVDPPYLMQAKPHAPPNAPLRVDLYTFGTQMGISFDGLSGDATGGATILSYNLQIDSAGGGSGPWADVIGDPDESLDLETVITALDGGTTYYFQYRAKNAHGWGEFSPISLVLMATKPDKILASVTRTVNVDTDVEISWDETPDDRDSDVSAYRIKIKKKNGTFAEYLDTCDGTDATIVTNRQCTVAMDVLTADPYFLVEGDLIVAVIEA